MLIFLPYLIIIVQQFYNSLQCLQFLKRMSIPDFDLFYDIIKYLYNETNSIEVKQSEHILDLQFT